MKPSRYLAVVAGLLGMMVLSTPAFANGVVLPFTNGLAAPNSANLLINLNNIYNVTNTGGTITFNPTTETLSMTSTITSISSGNMVYTGDFGTVTFTTGALTSGSIYGYATFNGGTYTYTTNGTDGLPNGVLFSGTFGLIHWHKIGNTDEFWFSAYGIHETSVLVSGTTQFNVVQGAVVIPEPGTLVLAGTGLCFVAGAVWLAGLQRRGRAGSATAG
jgi:hypothetical protein